MSCTVNYNQDSSIRTVNTPQGVESRLFKSIAAIPQISSLEEALGIYKNRYTEDLKSEDEPVLEFLSDKGNPFPTYKEALKSSSGGNIEIGVNVQGEFNKLMTVSSNINPNSYGGLINNLIKEDILSDQKITQDGKVFFKAEGIDPALQLVNEIIIKEEAQERLNRKNVIINQDGRIELLDEANTVKIGGKIVAIEEVRNSTMEQLTKKYGPEAARQMTINNMVNEVLSPKPQEAENKTTEDSLKFKLLDLLNDMGVKVMSISNYIQSYKRRNGVDPSVEALADIANQVVAFKDGSIPVDVLTEETAHFIVEAWDEVEIENIIRNIQKTSSYQEFSEHYRELYRKDNPNMSEEEIENLVRREVLGKELAKSLKERFSTEGKTETQQSIIIKMYDLFIGFIKNIFLSDDFSQKLETLSIKVGDLILNRDLSKYINLEQLRNKKFNMYSANTSGSPSVDTKSNVYKLLIKTLLDQEKLLIKSGIGSRAQVQRLTDAMDTALTVNSALDLIKLARRYAVYLSDAIKSAQSKSKTLSNEEGIVLANLKDNISPILEQLRVSIKDDSELKVIEEDLDDVLKRIGDVKGEIANAENTILNSIVDRLMARSNVVDPTIRPELMKAIENATKDTQMLYSWFGQITHAHDPLLGLLGSVIADMSFEAEVSYQQRVKGFQKIISDLGFRERDLAQLYDKDGYILSQYDFSQFEKDVLKIRAEQYKIYSGTASTVEEISKKLQDGTIEPIADKAQEVKYKEEVTKQINTIIERSFNDQFYEEREAKFNYLNISAVTRVALKALSTDLGEFMARAKTENGLPRYKYQDRYNLDGINLRRRAAKSLFNDDGKIKNGITKVNEEKIGSTITFSGNFYELDPNSSNEEAIIAFEMHKIDADFIAQKNAEAALNGGQKIDIERLAPKFLEELQRIEKLEGREAAVEFFLLNSVVGFPANFWNNYDTSTGMASKLDEYLNSSEAENTYIDLIEGYKQETEERKQIIKRYQDSKNYTNILASEIPAATKQKILELSESIDKSYALLYSKFKDTLTSSDDPENRQVESTPNQAYREALKDNKKTTPKEKLDFAMKHMTPDNRKKVSRFMDALDDLKAGKFVSENLKMLISNNIDGSLDDISTVDIDAVKLRYAESKLAVYFRAFSPIGLEDFYTNLLESNSSVYNLVTNLNNKDNIKVSNNFSYYEIGEIKNKNKNYKENFEGGNRQPKLSKYLNPRFVQKFNPILDRENNPILDKDGNIQVTTNQKLFELYKEYLKFHTDSLNAYGENGLHNVYLAPQISKTKFQKIQGLVQGKKGTLKDMWKDATRFRVDELEFGEQLNGESLAKKSNTRLLPKYFMNKLESAEDVMEDIFNSSALFAQQAELYKAKKDRYSEFSTLSDKVLNRNYPDGKSAESSNTYKMFKSYLDYNLFGIKEMKQWRVNLPFIGQVDLTKIVNLLHGWLRNTSLALNVIVPATSWITAESTLFIEKVLGQYVDKSSISLANSEFIKISRQAMTESLDVNSTSKMSIVGEHFRVFDLTKRFENSIYNNGIRTLSKSFYLLHTAANFVPLSKAILSQLYGTRIYGGLLVDFKKFEELKKISDPNTTKESLKAAWTSLEDKNLYNYITIDSKTNTMTYNYDKLAVDMGKTPGEDFEVEIKNLELGVATKIKKLVERIDGQISNEERTVLQRHVLGRFIMTHRGWLSISASNRFKKKHFNFQTGQIEEGSYLSVAGAIVNSINKGLTQEGLMGALKGLKNVYKNSSEVERENIKRVLIETAIMQGIFFLSLALSGWADDEKDMLIAQATAYLFERLSAETASSQLGVIGEFYSAAKEPIIGFSKIQGLLQVQNAFDTTLVDRGRYKGLTKQEQYIVKNVVGAKSYFDLSSAKNLKSQRDSYDFFNKEEALIPVAYFIDEKSSGAFIDY